MFLLKRCLIKKVWSPLRSLASAWRTRAQVKPGGAAWDGAAVPLSRRACKWRFSQNPGEVAGISPPPAACPGVLAGTTIGNSSNCQPQLADSSLWEGLSSPICPTGALPTHPSSLRPCLGRCFSPDPKDSTATHLNVLNSQQSCGIGTDINPISQTRRELGCNPASAWPPQTVPLPRFLPPPKKQQRFWGTLSPFGAQTCVCHSLDSLSTSKAPCSVHVDSGRRVDKGTRDRQSEQDPA